jgi:hypothetical protein
MTRFDIYITDELEVLLKPLEHALVGELFMRKFRAIASPI